MKSFCSAAIALLCTAGLAVAELKPDITVAADGSGNFKTVQEALNSIPRNNTERRIVLMKDGVYKEQISLNASFVTLLGQSRKGTRIEFATSDTGRGARGSVFTINGTDTVMQNLSIINTFGVVGPHEMAVFGRQCDRTVIIDCDLLSQGADTLSLWQGESGRYYHARLYVTGAADFICPRGWCYMTDSVIYEVKPGSAGMWHDGSKNKDQKFVMRNCTFDGVEGWRLARHHHDAWIFFLDCTFSKTIADIKPYRVIYPLGNDPVTEASKARNAELDKTNIWGDRVYFHNAKKDGGNLPWMTDNLNKSDGSPKPEQITAKWTFAGTWDPEDTAGPKIVEMKLRQGQAPGEIVVRFSESVTVKGKPGINLGGPLAWYASGSGSDTLVFAGAGDITAFDLNGGAIIGTQAAALVRHADLKFPSN